MNSLFVRCTTVASVAVCVAAFALPTMAAPRIIEKRKLPMPQLPSSIIRRVTTSTEWPKPASKAQSPILIDERDCSGTTYRLWVISNRATIDAATIHDGYVYQATRRGVSKWRIEQETSRPGMGPFHHSLVACADGGIAIARANIGYEEPIPSHPKLGTIKSRSETKILPYDHFDSRIPWAMGRDRLGGWYAFDGVLQEYGTLESHFEDGALTLQGDSRIFLIERGQVIAHRPPWYKNLLEIGLTPNQRLRAYYYKMSDGYGVSEEIFDFDTITTTLRHYRIRNGEAKYSEVPELPTPAIEFIWRLGNGVELYIPPEKLLLHGLPPICRSTTPNCEQIDAYGWVTKEDATKKYIRYLITKDDKPTEYWEAIIQK